MAKPKDRSKANQRIAKRIKPASEIEDYLRFLIYGYPKKGKTRLCASAPDVLLVDINDKGTSSTRRDTNPNVFPVSTWSDINDLYWFLESGDHQYKTVALDGITGMQTLCMNFVLGEEKSLDASRDPDLPRGPTWQKASQMMKTQITNYRNLPMNVIFTALVRVRSSGDDEGDDDNEEVTITPNCMPSVASHLEAAVSIIGYLTVRKIYVKKKVKVKGGKSKLKKVPVTRTRLIVGNNERYITGDRTGLFGEYVDSPDISEMLRIYNGQEE